MTRTAALFALLLPLLAACTAGDPFEIPDQQMEAQRTWMENAVNAGDPNAIREALLFGDGMFHPQVMADGLCRAVEKGDMKVAESLLQSGARPEGWGETGRTPLMCAARGGHDDIVRYLLGRGADVDRTDAEGLTALHFAAGAGDDFGQLPTGWNPADRENVLVRLVSSGADPNAADKYGRTPLHHAVAAGDAGIVKVLLAAGATPDTEDKKGVTPAQLAEENGFVKALALFAELP